MKRRYVLYVGSRGVRSKNFPALLRAFAAAEATRGMRAVGGGAAGGGAQGSARRSLPWGWRGVSCCCRAWRRRTWVSSIAALHCSSIRAFMRDLDCPPLEAMSARCPVLVSRSSALPEVCGEAAHYFDPAVEGALERELGRVLGDRKLLRSKVDAGRAWVGRYTWETSAQGTLAAYREALDRAQERTAAGSARGVSGLKY